MLDSEQQDFDDDVRRAMKMFERAKIGEVAPLTPRRPQRMLLALDHSSQDQMSQRVARHLKQRFECQLDVVDGNEDTSSNAVAESAASELGARALPKIEGENYEQLIAAISQSQCDMLTLPSPFQRELEKVGTDSTGTVIDVLLAHTTVPLLVVRNTYELEASPFSHVVLVLVSENEAAAEAARWACGMVAPGGQLDLMLVVEEEIFENVRVLMQSLDPELDISLEKLGEAMQHSHARLHRACQKTAAEHGFNYRLDARHEGETPLAELTGGRRHPLIVVALEQPSHMSQGHVHDRIRHASHPVLVVPLDRPESQVPHDLGRRKV